jgi:pyruvate/2-oxoglutarate dehydrogenase complex dihydrolipoamide acyltransferase (E2) component
MSAATPLARSAARQAERAIEELASARGDGARVTLADIIEPRAVQPAAATPRLRDGAAGAVAQAMARQSGVDIAALASARAAALPAAQPALRGSAVAADSATAQLDEAHGFPPSRRTRLSSMRRVIADRLAASKRDAPH